MSEKNNFQPTEQHAEQEVVDLPHYVVETQQPPPPYQLLPSIPSTTGNYNAKCQNTEVGLQDADISCSFKGYEDGIRKRLAVNPKIQPTISLWSVLKSIIGQDFLSLSVPVSFNEPLSQLQRCAEDLEYSNLLDIAAEQENSANRMIYVAAFAYSKYASTTGVYAKPFNPLLGETYEYVRPDESYRLIAEQVSHHPPNSAIWAESSKWTYRGESAVKSTFYGKSFDIVSSGTWFLKLRLASGLTELYTWNKPAVLVTLGVVSGLPTVDNYGPLDIKNWMTGDVCAIDSWKVSSDSEFSGRVKDVSGRVRFNIGGRLNSRIYAQAPTENSNRDGSMASTKQKLVVWEAKQLPSEMPFNLTPFLITLNDNPDKLQVYLPPTDTRFRPDQRAVEENNYDLAAAEKKRLEEKQRERRRERESTCEDFVPRWFRRARCDVTDEEYWDFDGSYWKERESRDGEKWKGVEGIFSSAAPAKYIGR